MGGRLGGMSLAAVAMACMASISIPSAPERKSRAGTRDKRSPHQATIAKPKSDSLKRMLGRR